MARLLEAVAARAIARSVAFREELKVEREKREEMFMLKVPFYKVLVNNAYNFTSKYG
jgi:hypothetical protein